MYVRNVQKTKKANLTEKISNENTFRPSPYISLLFIFLKILPEMCGMSAMGGAAYGLIPVMLMMMAGAGVSSAASGAAKGLK